MFARIAFIGFALLAPFAVAADKLDVRVDPRVELLSIVFRLAGNPEYNMPNSASPYSKDVDEHFGRFKDHEAVKLAQQLRQKHGVSFDAVMSMAVHLADEPWQPHPRTPLNPRPALLERRWTVSDAEKFVAVLGKFTRDSDFKSFYEKHGELYDKSAKQLSDVVNKAEYLPWFDRFFGTRPNARFTVIVGMLNGGGNYGMSMRFPDGKEEITPVIGVYAWDNNGLPAIGSEIIPTVVHEFCHSYSNAIVDEHYAALKDAGDKLFDAKQSIMRRQAYSSGKTVLYETLVRACVTHYMKVVQGEDAGAKQIAEENGNGFIWMPRLVDALGEYDSNRKRYPSFDDFVPRLTEVLNAAAADATTAAANAPKVVKVSPENGDDSVDPAKVTAIVVTFDRPMRDKQWSIVGGGEHFPKFGKPSYDASKKVLTVPVQLEMGKSYRFGLNSASFRAFTAADGTPLEPMIVQFQTKQ